MAFKLTSPLQNISAKPAMFTGLCALLLMAVAIAMVVAKHTSRSMHANLQSFSTETDNLNNEWNQLLLERATWTSAIRVEQVAVEQLQMIIPTKVEMIKP